MLGHPIRFEFVTVFEFVECAARFEFVTGRPIRFYVGGIGGNRTRGIRPMPFPHVPMVNAQGVSMGMVDARCPGSGNPSQRPRPASACGDVDMYCSRSSVQVHAAGDVPLAVMREPVARVAAVLSGIV